MEKENIDRHTEKVALEIEISDIIWRMHQKTYISTITLISMQLALCVLLVVLQILFKDVKTDFYDLTISNLVSLVIPFINIGLMIAVVIINRVNNKAWYNARDEYHKVFNLMDDMFNKNYNIDNQYQLINTLSNYKKEKIKPCKKKNIKMQKEKHMK